MKRQAAIIASVVFIFVLIAIHITADIPIGGVVAISGGGGNLTVSGTGAENYLLTYTSDITGVWTNAIVSLSAGSLTVTGTMNITQTNSVLTTDGSGNVSGVVGYTTIITNGLPGVVTNRMTFVKGVLTTNEIIAW